MKQLKERLLSKVVGFEKGVLKTVKLKSRKDLEMAGIFKITAFKEFFKNLAK